MAFLLCSVLFSGLFSLDTHQNVPEHYPIGIVVTISIPDGSSPGYVLAVPIAHTDCADAIYTIQLVSSLEEQLRFLSLSWRKLLILLLHLSSFNCHPSSNTRLKSISSSQELYTKVDSISHLKSNGHSSRIINLAITYSITFFLI